MIIPLGKYGGYSTKTSKSIKKHKMDDKKLDLLRRLQEEITPSAMYYVMDRGSTTTVTGAVCLEFITLAECNQTAVLNDDNRAKVLAVINHCLKCHAFEPTINLLKDLKGQSFVFTGFRDARMQQQIEALGGIVANHVGPHTTYLVVKNITASTAKITEARYRGIAIVSMISVHEWLHEKV